MQPAQRLVDTTSLHIACLLSQRAVQRAWLGARRIQVQFWGLLFINVFAPKDLRILSGFFNLEAREPTESAPQSGPILAEFII